MGIDVAGGFALAGDLVVYLACTAYTVERVRALIREGAHDTGGPRARVAAEATRKRS